MYPTKGLRRALASASLAGYLLAGCGDGAHVTSTIAGDWRYEITVRPFDEFSRPQQLAGPCRISIVEPGQRVDAVVNPGDSVCTVTGILGPDGLVTAEANGYYPAQWTILDDEAVYAVRRLTLGIYSVVPAASHIDSIGLVINTLTPQIRVRSVTSNTLPVDGSRSCVVFFGLSPFVSPRWGDYILSTQPLAQAPGTNWIESEDYFQQLRAKGAASGSTVYVTARLMTGATSWKYDTATDLMVYSGLEDYTHTVTTFLMP